MSEVVQPAETVKHLRLGYDSGLTRPLEWRRSQLRQIQRMLGEQEARWLDVLEADLHSQPWRAGRPTSVPSAPRSTG